MIKELISSRHELLVLGFQSWVPGTGSRILDPGSWVLSPGSWGSESSSRVLSCRPVIWVLVNLIIVTKCDKKLLQSVSESYYKVWQLLQSVTVITKCDRYYKMWVISKWDVTLYLLFMCTLKFNSVSETTPKKFYEIAF